jgi:RsiW-degrading membrane proteinase PrsW (M82 family)
LIEYWLRLTAATLAWLWSMFQIYDTYRQRKWRSVIGNAFISIVLAVVIVTMLRR